MLLSNHFIIKTTIQQLNQQFDIQQIIFLYLRKDTISNIKT